MASKGEGADKEVHVIWENWDGEPTWVKVDDNPELKKFLDKNEANPYSCTLARNTLTSKPQPHMNQEVMALRQAIFDSLNARWTGDGQLGRQMRVCATVPFSKEVFDSCFLTQNIQDVPLNDASNVTAYITAAQLTSAIGPDWGRRGFKTSTVTYVNFNHKIHLTWGYKKRINFLHKECPR